MKLLNLTGKYYALTSVVIVILGGFIGYQVQKYHINKQFNRQLERDRDQLVYELSTNQRMPETFFLNVGDRIELEQVSQDDSIAETLADTIMYDAFAEEELLFRRMTFTTKVDGQNYRVDIYKSLLPTEELISGIGEIMLLLLAGLLLAILLVNRYLSRLIWGPFYGILRSIHQFNLSEPFHLKKTDTRVDEFNELHEAVEGIFGRSKKDYHNLKEFTENASHEFQTPLAIIKAKTELMLQSDALSEEEVSGVKSIYDAAHRLSKLNQSFILLARIDNEQFVSNQTIHIATYIDDILATFSELIDMRQIRVTVAKHFDPVLIINDTLAFTLFSNLIGNAIKHNEDGGFIDIKINETEIIMSNSGPAPDKDPETLFERFHKSDASNSPGLGLAIVKKICDYYHFSISYKYGESGHKLTLSV